MRPRDALDGVRQLGAIYRAQEVSGMADKGTLGIGLHFDDVAVGDTFRTAQRTLFEADLAAFCNLTWLTEELFTRATGREEMAIPARVVPAALVYSFAEGLLLPMMQHTGLAFLAADLRVRAPTCVGDTIHVACEVIEARPTSDGRRGLVRTRNRVLRQDGTITLEYDPLRLLRRRRRVVTGARCTNRNGTLRSRWVRRGRCR